MKVSVTSRDTNKEFQKLSMTKIYSVGFNNDVELSFKKMKSKKDLVILGIFCVNESGNLMGRGNVGAKTQEPNC